MFFGKNLQYLRKSNQNMTQECLAERMNVSRQTISRWESGEVLPEVSKLLELSEIFSCTLDSLLQEDLTARSGIYLPVRIERIAPFRYAALTIISKEPEEHAFRCLQNWTEQNALSEPIRIGWDFPYVSQEQKHRFGLRGYTAAAVLPENFEPRFSGAEILKNPQADYAVMTIREPCVQPFERIPGAYRLIMEFLSTGIHKKKYEKGTLSCFEREYIRDGVGFMDIYIHCQPGETPKIHTNFTSIKEEPICPRI